MALRALQAEQDRWRVETHSLAYPGKALDDSGLNDWDDEPSERVPPRYPTKTQRASQQMALAVTGLLSAKFQDKVAGLHGQELDAVLDAALLETELGRAAHNARDEVKTYLKQASAGP
ncbi:hypothetical protein HaLaN_18167 [Haematococcus lacustris]|uniref:Uncharacterized protein n=1 Tax=Haematococcus lacustris TaxID=44745 RepID=A0A699ZRC9_HAELA|nr:hypothetical protein HaLaN_18167 [Haematococcus lacustris]